jgi:hypothetical protein
LNCAPNNLLFQSTAFNNGLAAVVQSYNLITSLTLTPGIYWLSYLSSSGPSVRSYQVVNGSPNIIGERLGTIFNGPQNFVFQTLAYTSSIPTTFGTWSVSTNVVPLQPYVYFRIQ